MDVQTAAAYYLAKGWIPVPIPEGKKGPTFKNWQNFTCDASKVEQRFHQDCNIGLLTGERSGHLIVIDLDHPLAIQLAAKHLPDTATCGKESTPTSHWFYYCQGIENKNYNGKRDDNGKQPRLMEILSSGRQCVVYPSIHPSGERYTELKGTIITIDADVLLECCNDLATAVWNELYVDGTSPQPKQESKQESKQAKQSNQQSAKPVSSVVERASAYLATKPPSISGAGGHNALFDAARCLVSGFKLNDADAFGLLWHEFNPRCQPAWSEREIRHKIEQCHKHPSKEGEGYLLDDGDFDKGSESGKTKVDTHKLVANMLAKVVDSNHRADPGSTPEELLDVPGFIGEIVDHTLKVAPYPNRILAFSAAVALLGYLTGRKVQVDGNIRSNVLVLALANSSSGKDAPRNVIKSVLVQAGIQNGMLGNVASQEGLEDFLANAKSAILLQDEMHQLIAEAGIGKDLRKQAIITKFTELNTSASSVYTCRAKAGGTPVTINQPHLVVLGTSIPCSFYASLSKEMLSNGFFARMLILDAGKRGSGQDPQMEAVPARVIEQAKWWHDFQPAGNLDLANPRPRQVQCSSEARRLFAELRTISEAEYAKAEELDDQAAMSTWGRAVERAKQMALIYACSQSPESPEIGLQAAQWACKLVSHQVSRMLYLAARYATQSEFEAMCQLIVEKLRQWKNKTGNDWMPLWKLNRELRKYPTKDRNSGIQSLVDEATVEIRDGGSVNMKGRKGHLLRLMEP